MTGSSTSDHSVTGEPGRAVRTGGLKPPAYGLLSIALILFLAACKPPDNRITLEQLRALESQSSELEPVQLDPKELALTELHPYNVGPGDVLDVTLVGTTDSYSQNVLRMRVRDDGFITLPLVGKVRIGGLTLQAVDDAIFNAYVPRFLKDLSVYVELSGPESTTVVVVGAAGQGGLITLPGNERNVLYAVGRSGGFGTATSGRVTVRPINPDRPVVSYDLTRINDLRRALLAPPLQSGDMLVVEPAEVSAVYVTGLVNAPGPVTLPPDGKLSLVRVLSTAGGVRDFLNPSVATLWRRLPDGRQVRVKLQIADIMSGEADDIALHPGDILNVPHTLNTRFREWAMNNILIGPFGVTSTFDPVADARARNVGNNSNNNSFNNGTFLRSGVLNSVSGGVSNLLIPPVSPPGAP